ncbi:FtsX-like permease family protein [Planctomonas sp. JC2975]|uniref:ABC transporter permease n=1 Tax=Planctomonas sp. JC2975 TaxID=2729626 RepID=UPI0014758ECB|nr:ABC transporter permease [Planctomonas sp. JC2975]NNC11997.1 FtsX-like permease family protein [Planctomonas sp. JC2975]
MFLTYLRRELSNRKKQTVIIAVGMALAIALVILVNGVSTGVKDAEATALESVNGVGTDITISQTAKPGSGNQRFDFGSGNNGNGSDGSTSLSQSRLSTAMGSASYSASALTKVKAVDGVKAATATLSLQNSTFSGQIAQQGSSSGSDGSSGSQSQTTPPSGSGSGSSSSSGMGPSSFGIDQFTVTGISLDTRSVGPMSSTTPTSGRYLSSTDSGKDNVVLDSSYAKSASKKVGDTVKIGDTSFKVVGIVKSTSSSSTTASNSYIPLDTAQKVADLDGKITNVYVTAVSAGDVSTLKTALEKVLPSATVNTQADLAASISGSLSTVSALVTNLGTWLSLLVLAAAFLIAVLFTISGVSRRTREFGTLKAIGWSNGHVVRQVTGESLVNGLIGGAVGALVGIASILIVNWISPTLSVGSGGAPSGGGARSGAGAAAGAPSGFPGGGASAAQSGSEIALHVPLTAGIILIAVGLSVLGGLIAGAFGGWWASRLRPAEALRSVA